MHSWNIFGARMSHGQIQIHKIHHGPDLGGAITFPLIVYFVPLHEAHIQMAFWMCESQNSHNWNSRDFVGPKFCMQTFDWNEV